jgi:hypothetical protein
VVCSRAREQLQRQWQSLRQPCAIESVVQANLAHQHRLTPEQETFLVQWTIDGEIGEHRPSRVRPKTALLLHGAAEGRLEAAGGRRLTP